MENLLKSHLEALISFRTTAESAEAKAELLDYVTSVFLKKDLEMLVRGEVDGSPYLYLPRVDATLLWFAHIDVVPGRDDQFTVHYEGDHALGRGVKDMKGAALPFLMAYGDARTRGEDPPVSILLTSDEEVAGRTIPTLLAGGVVQAPVAFTPDTGSSSNLVVEHKGVCWADLVCTGRSGHCAIPWETENPIWKLTEALRAIRERFPEGGPDDWIVTVTPAELSGSSARNQVPSEVCCSLDIRFPLEECATPDQALARVQECLPGGCAVKEVLSASGLKTDAGHTMVHLYKEVAQSVLSEDVPVGREQGATDARYFGEVGIPAFLHGPLGGDLHGEGEWVSIPSLIDHYHIATKLFVELPI